MFQLVPPLFQPCSTRLEQNETKIKTEPDPDSKTDQKEFETMTETETGSNQTDPVADAFQIIRAVNRSDDETFRSAIENGINPATIVTLANIALACGADQSGGSVDAWIDGLENRLVQKGTKA